MKRANKKRVVYSIEEEPTILSKAVLDLLLKTKYPSDCISLYCFYYYTAKWQHTNQPKATVQFVSKALKMGEHRIRRTKNILRGLNLIQDVTVKDKRNRVTQWYVKVNFIWAKNHPNKNERVVPNSTLTKFHRVENNKTNALSSVSLNALSTGTPTPKKTHHLKQKTFQKISKKLADIISSHKKINCTSKLSQWEDPIRLLMTKDLKVNGTSFKDIKKRVTIALNFYEKNIGKKYIPVIESGNALRVKFLKLENAKIRERHDQQKDPNRMTESERSYSEMIKGDSYYYSET